MCKKLNYILVSSDGTGIIHVTIPTEHFIVGLAKVDSLSVPTILDSDVIVTAGLTPLELASIDMYNCNAIFMKACLIPAEYYFMAGGQRTLTLSGSVSSKFIIYYYV